MQTGKEQNGRFGERSKTVSADGHVPAALTPTGNFCSKLCARSLRRVRDFGVNFVEGDSKEGCGAERRLRRI